MPSQHIVGEVVVKQKIEEIDQDLPNILVAPTTFGEVSLLFDTKQTASIIACSPVTVVWSINRDTFKQTMQHTNKKEFVTRSAFLRRVNILKHLSDYQVAKLGQVAERQTYRKDQCVVRQNAIGNGLYIILSGKCKVFKTIENVETVIAELTDGDYFGEKELKSEHDEISRKWEQRSRESKTVTG